MTAPTEHKSRKLEVNDPGKMLLLSVALVGGFVSLLVSQVQENPATIGFGIVMAVIGYLTGNGKLARSGKAPQPTITSPSQLLTVDELATALAPLLATLSANDDPLAALELDDADR